MANAKKLSISMRKWMLVARHGTKFVSDALTVASPLTVALSQTTVKEARNLYCHHYDFASFEYLSITITLDLNQFVVRSEAIREGSLQVTCDPLK